MDFLFGSKISAAIDIGSHTFKWAAVDRKKGLCYVWHEEIMPERESRKDVLPEDALQTRLQSLVQKCQAANSVWNKQVTASASSHQIFYGYLEVNKIQPKDLKFSVTNQLLPRLPRPLEELEILCLPVSPLSGRADRSGAFYAMIPQEVVDLSRRRVEACGLKLSGLGVIPVALARCWGRNLPPGSGLAEEMVALVHLGFERTTVVMARGDTPYGVRDFQPAAGHFTYAFQVGQQSSWRQAEEARRNYNVAQQREHFIEPDLRKWLGEVERSLQHFRSKHKEFPLTRVVLSGGGACWPGLVERVEESLHLPVQADSWSHLRPTTICSEQEALLHKVSIGCALA